MSQRNADHGPPAPTAETTLDQRPADPTLFDLGLGVADLLDIFENAPCGYLALSQDGLILKANHTFGLWTGFDAPDLAGRPFTDLLNIAGRLFYEKHFAPLLRLQGFFNEVALDVIASDGARIPLLASAQRRDDAEGRLRYVRITVIKAIDRRRYERDLVKANALAAEQLTASEARLLVEQDVSELREQFIAVLGHDLRNPLAAISSGVRLLQRDPTRQRADQLAAMMQASVQRMAVLIENVLDFTRGRLGDGIGLTLAPTDLGPRLGQVVDELRTSHPDRTIRAHIDLPGLITCDPSRVEQLLSNLLGNACAHGLPGAPIEVRAISDGGGLEISVANQGRAIPAILLARLFEPFVRGEAVTTRKGLGLGLFIASEIAKAHGGLLTAVSSRTETRFTFRMTL